MPLPNLAAGAAAGVLDPKQPTLLPNLDRVIASGSGTMDHMSPAMFLATYPRVDASFPAITVSGAPVVGDVYTVTLTNNTFPGLPGIIAIAYTAGAAPTAATVAAGLALAISQSALCAAAGVYAEVNTAGLLQIFHNGAVGNFTTATIVKTSGSGTGAFAPASGSFSGGSGPVMATANFVWGVGGQSIPFWVGNLYNLGYDMITQMVAQGMAIA